MESNNQKSSRQVPEPKENSIYWDTVTQTYCVSRNGQIIALGGENELEAEAVFFEMINRGEI